MSNETTTDAAGAPAPAGPPAVLTHAQIKVVVFAVMAGMLLAALDMSIVGTALPKIVSQLGGLNDLSWVVTAYLITSTAVTPLWGKLSDLYGRRLAFQSTIGIFLLGSALAGLSQNMPELITFRALQGIGGGGLFSIALAIIGDVIPPRERGRYQGYFGAVFGASSVVGPLLGGLFTDTIGWRWIFYINLPVGAVALYIITTALRTPFVRREHTIDYAGAGTIVSAVTALVLYLTLAGQHSEWTKPQYLGLIAAFVLLTVAFVLIERRAAEPILPMRLFQRSIFTVASIYSFLAGIAMFGAVIFLPEYLQVVKGMSATESGLAMIPMVVGIAGLSIVAGRLVSKTGRYKVWPIAGAVILVIGMFDLAHLHTNTPYWQIALGAFIVGTGLGFTMQTLMVAVQNDVEYRDMGTATSGITFFRQIGSALGVALLGSILSSRLVHYLGPAAPGVPAPDASKLDAIKALPEPVKGHVLAAFSSALDDVFLVAIPFVVIALVVALFLKEIPLRTGHAPAETPTDTDMDVVAATH
ncbi:MAG: hypothetical protein QOF57_2148 [Frankiaceae bacterium]|nr:hypothetical protein [Frankiaceae bacterium]